MIQHVNTRKDCAEVCRQTSDCTWFSFDEESRLCFAMETCIKEDTDYQRFYSGKVTSVGDVISMKVDTVALGTLVNFDTYYQLPKGQALSAFGNQCLSLVPFD